MKYHPNLTADAAWKNWHIHTCTHHFNGYSPGEPGL